MNLGVENCGVEFCAVPRSFGCTEGELAAIGAEPDPALREALTRRVYEAMYLAAQRLNAMDVRSRC